MKHVVAIVILVLLAIVASPLGDGTAEAVYLGGGGCTNGCVCNHCILFYGCFCDYNNGSPCACQGNDGGGVCMVYGWGCSVIIVEG